MTGAQPLGPTPPGHLFVYGTLRPGDVRWPMLEPFVIDHGWPDSVRGRLFDTGLGYPAATFSTGADGADDPLAVVHGHTVALLAASLHRALEVLDAEEDTVVGLYRRIEVVTDRGIRAWAYVAGIGLELTPITSGDWFRRSTT